jgi:hypothetical protein
VLLGVVVLRVVVLVVWAGCRREEWGSSLVG